jgi:threonine dehydrogenase-like Zn-dependent dehydrogenase
MRAVAVTEPGQVRIVELDKPEAGPYQALVRTEAACLCNATDRKLVAGHFPGVDRYPLVLGHESAGIVEAVGAKVRNFQLGQRAIGGLLFEFRPEDYASGWGGFCEYTLVNDHDAMVADGVADAAHGWAEVYEIQRAVPGGIPLEAAVLLCTWREVYGGFGDFHLEAGDDVVIFGAGPVGLSFVKLGRLLGLGYIGVVDPVEAKRAWALGMGADEVFAPDSARLEELKERRGQPLNAVIDAVGSESVVNAGLRLIGMGGAICVYGVIAEPSLTIRKHRGPYNFNLYVHQWPTRSRERAAMEPLCNWIRSGQLRPGDFITHEFPLEKIGDALAAVESGQSLKVLLRY